MAKPDKRKGEKPESITGTYRYDPNSDSIVKVSDRIPSVASKLRGGTPCGDSCGDTGSCGTGSCPAGGCGGFGGLDD
jgi:hypothetical protein